MSDATSGALPDPKAGHLVRNARRRRWGQVLWDSAKHRFETGDPTKVLVHDFEHRTTDSWPLADIDLVASRGAILYEDATLAARLDAEWREAEGRPAKARKSG